MSNPFSGRGLADQVDGLRPDALRNRVAPSLAHIPGGGGDKLVRWEASQGDAFTHAAAG